MQPQQFSVSQKAILVGLFLSKFDKEALSSFSFGSFWEAFNTLAYAIRVKPATIKNYRDEFDPYFPNPRKGWHGRQMKSYCQTIFDKFSSLPLQEFIDLIKHIILEDYLQEDFPGKLTNQSESVAKRLITGRAAEEYFRLNYRSVPDFGDHDIQDTTLLACGYDFETTQNGLMQFCVEVKGLAKNSGNISLTEKEYYVAEKLKERYCLFIVLDFEKNPHSIYHFNPLRGHINFKRIERQVTQVVYNTMI